jgi:penicillin amidase
MDLEEARSVAEKSLPVTAGCARVAGLHEPVTIRRDGRGIPYVRAATALDAVFGAAYALAQDRLWQLDLFRKIAAGRSAELLGPALFGLDSHYRRLRVRRYAEAEWASQAGSGRDVLEAYAAGVDAAMSSNPLPVEFAIVGVTPEPWTPVDSLSIYKMATLTVAGGYTQKLLNLRIAARFGSETLRELLREAPQEATTGVEAAYDWDALLDGLDAAVLETAGKPDGSNNWAVSGALTASGKPLLAGDPHLPISVPAQWYQVSLSCPEFSAAGVWSPGYPGFMYYGFNGSVAWSVTTSTSDQHEVYLERMRDGAGPEYETAAGWQPCTVQHEMLRARGGESREIELMQTGHGPVLQRADGRGLSLRWAARGPSHDFDAVLPMMKAQTAAEFCAALALLESNHSNFIVADTGGKIRYQLTGRLPRRPFGGRAIPVPGWDGKHEWDGWIPFEEMPCVEDPPSGWLATANNRIDAPAPGRHLQVSDAGPYRVERIRELLRSRGHVSVRDFQAMQGDQTSIALRSLGRSLAAALDDSSDPRARSVCELLAGWQGETWVDSAAAAIVTRVRDGLVDQTTGRIYREVSDGNLGTLPRKALHRTFEAGSSGLLDGFAEDWPAALRKALGLALDELEAELGPDPSVWALGRLQQMQFRHNLGRQQPWDELFNLPALPIGGDFSTVFCVSPPDGSRTADNGTSFRVIVDLAEPRVAWTVLPPGQSGHPASPHYGDGCDAWLNVAYRRLCLDEPETVEAELSLEP